MGEGVEHFHDIPNSHKHAFLVDYNTAQKENGKELEEFIKGFDKKISAG